VKRKKIRAIKKNKELIKTYKKEITLDHFLGLEKIKLTCIKCQTTYNISTHRPELYTEEVLRNYICLLCRK